MVDAAVEEYEADAENSVADDDDNTDVDDSVDESGDEE